MCYSNNKYLYSSIDLINFLSNLPGICLIARYLPNCLEIANLPGNFQSLFNLRRNTYFSLVICVEFAKLPRNCQVAWQLPSRLATSNLLATIIH